MPLPTSRFDSPRDALASGPTPAPPGGANGAIQLCSSVAQALAELGRHPRKALGQHFLAQPQVARRIAELAQVVGQQVIEIGPGLGALTQFLLDAEHLWLVEIDGDFARRLQTLLAQHPRVHVLHADALALNWGEFARRHGPLTLVGNLPYNIATRLLTDWLNYPEHIDRIVVMVQREVAERLRARPGTKAYSALSVLTQAVATTRKGFSVAAGAFVPPPQVSSEVVVIEPDARRKARVNDWAFFRDVVRTAFRHRRKQLRNTLLPLSARSDAILEQLSIDPRARAEELEVEDFLRLAEALSGNARAS